MELPQPRAFGTDAGRKTTHDFLSLCSPVEQAPRPRQGGCLRTHDFLQPLEQAETTSGKEESKVEVTIADKPPPPAPPPSMEHILPGGIGTYSISYLQRVPKPEGSLFTMAQPSSTDRNNENSNCSSYMVSGFTLWDESAVKKGKTGKENISVERHILRETGVNTGGQQTAVMEWPSQSSSNLKHSTATFSSFSSSHKLTAQNNHSFLNMITSAKSAQEEDEEEEEEEEFVIKKEPSSHPKGNLSVKTDGKSNYQKPNTPRSKHSATEQRRRSKINDRFQMLRDIIPHSDQKRDKASFLLEVIEYIQFLQEKVQKHEGSDQGWEHEPTKFPWNKCQRGAQDFIDHSQGTNNVSDPALMFASKFADSKPVISRTIPINGQKAEPDISTALIKDSGHQEPVSLPFNTNIFPFCGTSNIALQIPKLASDRDESTSQHQSQFPQSGSNICNHAVASNEPKDQDPTIESGTISISSIYSQGLLSTLTQALQSAGVDLTQAGISVHIDLGKRANGRLNSPASTIKGGDVSTSNQPIPRSIVTSAGEESGQALKRIKISGN